MANFPTYEQMAKNVAEKALDDFLYNGKSIREWMQIIAQEDCISRQAVLDQTYLWSKDEFLRVTNPFDYLRKRINSLPPITPQPKIDVLDKISAEIEQMNNIDYVEPVTVDEVLKIIDKYKAESEDKE